MLHCMPDTGLDEIVWFSIVMYFDYRLFLDRSWTLQSRVFLILIIFIIGYIAHQILDSMKFVLSMLIFFDYIGYCAPDPGLVRCIV